MEMMEKKTPLYECHVKANAKMVAYAGYRLPVQYSDGIIAEHNAVRTKAGLFDVSHMGEIFITGKDALKNINYLMTNDFTGMYDGQVRYSPMCNFNGGVIDDMLVMKYNSEKYLIVVNASNREKDAQWIKANISGNIGDIGDIEMKDVSDEYAQIALQGPASEKILSSLAVTSESIPLKYFSFFADIMIAGICCTVSKTGYTGEYGYEILCQPESAENLWNALLNAGKDEGLIPCGLGARDTLRLEAGMPLYGHEIDESITPLESGLSFAVKMDKNDFIGKQAMQDIQEKSAARKRIGLRVTGRGIVREHADIFIDGKTIGKTTSGTLLPFCGYAGAMALVEAGSVETGARVSVDVRGRIIEAEVIELPFYKRK